MKLLARLFGGKSHPATPVNHDSNHDFKLVKYVGHRAFVVGTGRMPEAGGLLSVPSNAPERGNVMGKIVQVNRGLGGTWRACVQLP